jgi:hypothetical protein
MTLFQLLRVKLEIAVIRKYILRRMWKEVIMFILKYHSHIFPWGEMVKPGKPSGWFPAEIVTGYLQNMS